MKIRFTLNQVGLFFEVEKTVWADTKDAPEMEWFPLKLWSHAAIDQLGTITSIKTKILLGITDRYELVPPGEYPDGEGRTVLCV